MRYIALLCLLSACGWYPRTLPHLGIIPTRPEPPTTPDIPSIPKLPCKQLNSVWSTPTTPENILMGQNSVNPQIYVLDLRELGIGSEMPFRANQSNVCYYKTVLLTNSYTIVNYLDVMPARYDCPEADNIQYDFVLQCNSLTITDRYTIHTAIYY